MGRLLSAHFPLCGHVSWAAGILELLFPSSFRSQGITFDMAKRFLLGPPRFCSCSAFFFLFGGFVSCLFFAHCFPKKEESLQAQRATVNFPRPRDGEATWLACSFCWVFVQRERRGIGHPSEGLAAG